MIYTIIEVKQIDVDTIHTIVNRPCMSATG